MNTIEPNRTPVLQSVTITANESPTAVVVSSFTAQKQGDVIVLQWETSNELDIIGFNLYRSVTSKRSTGNQALNKSLIQVRTPGSLDGNPYHFVDTEIEPGTMYYYWLEIVKLNETISIGPVSAGGYTIFVRLIKG